MRCSTPAHRPEIAGDLRLTPDLYNLSADDPHWKTVVQDPVEEIRRRASAAFPRDLLVAVFFDMERRDSSRPRAAISLSLRPSPADIPYCNCNRNFDDCFFWDGAGSYCSLGCYWSSSLGCGPGFVLRCDGYCTPPDPPPPD